MVAIAQPELAALSSEVSATLHVNAQVAYEVFADAQQTPRWLPLVKSARIVRRHPNGRPWQVAYAAEVDRGEIQYTLQYEFLPEELLITWTTAPQSQLLLAGEVRFLPLSPKASLMLYRLDLESNTASWKDDYDGHVAESVVAELKAHLRRIS